MMSFNENGDVGSEDGILAAFIAHLNNSTGTYAILSDLPDYPVMVSDLDMVVGSPRGFEKSVLEFCEHNGQLVVRKFVHATGIRYDLAEIRRPDTASYFQGPDVLVRLSRNTTDVPWFSLPIALARRVRNRHGYYVFRYDDQFLFHLVKKLENDSPTGKQLASLTALWRQASEEQRGALVDRIGSNAYGLLEEWLEGGPTQWSATKRVALLRALSLSPRPDLGTLWRNVKRISWRAVSVPGLQVNVLGADGSGKSTVIAGVLKELDGVFQGSLSVHLFPTNKTSEAGSGPTINEPQAQIPRGWFGSTSKLIVMIKRYVAGWATSIFWEKVRGRLVVFDRYYHDLLVDPARYRHSGPSWLVRLGAIFVPQPDIWIVLTAPVETIRARKSEVSSAETERQTLEYGEFANRTKNAVIIDASQTIDRVVADACNAILECMSERMKKRLGK